MANEPIGATLKFNRHVDVRHTVDVFVAGGGPAGIAAALAAAQQGCSVFLAENEICFGGMGTAGALPIFCHFTDGINFVAAGIGQKIYDRLFDAGGALPRSKRGDSDVLYQPEVLKRVYDALMTEAGVTFSLQTRVVGIESANGYISHALCHGKSGLFAVQAKAFVDATGDGDLCALAGAPFEKGDEQGRMQPGTLLSTWANIDWQKAEAAGYGVWNQWKHLLKAIDDNVFTVRDPGMPGIVPTGARSGNGSIGHLFGIDGTDERSITQAVLMGRKMMTEYETYFKKYLKGYESMELAGSACRVGIRETRRIMGDYTLTLADYKRRANFDDEIGRYCYTVDLHPVSLEATAERLDDFEKLKMGKGESYGIPYRTLTPRTLHNVLTAGRCVSTDRPVLGSLRVMPGCFITGQAAGTAAAMVAEKKTDIRSIDIKELQARLRALGAFLPNA